MDPRPSTEFSSKMHKSLRSLAEYLVDLTYLCCHYMFESYITCLTLSFNTVHVPSFTLIFLLWSWKVIISAARCSLEPRLFPMKLCPLCTLFHIAIKQLCDRKKNIMGSTNLVYSEKEIYKFLSSFPLKAFLCSLAKKSWQNAPTLWRDNVLSILP